jgi:CheY-like chemotaxis protein
MNGASTIANSDLALNSPPPLPRSNQAGGDMVQTRPKRSLRILCIDDDQHVRELLNDCLTHFGHRVVVASGGKEGLEMFRTATLKNQSYDVVITDMRMPEIDGRQVARTIKAESPHTPIIMLTGWGAVIRDDGDAPPGVDIVVNKPPHLQELNELLLRMAKPA